MNFNHLRRLIFLPTKPGFTNKNRKLKKYKIGDWTYGNPSVLSWQENTKLEIGRFCSIAEGVTILLGGEHHIDWVTTFPFTEFFSQAKTIQGHPHTKGDVIIENDVWIGTDVLILSGVHIGNGAVIGARSVISNDVKAYAVVAGNPAREIRSRFTASQIDELQRIARWNWELPQIIEAIPLLLQADIQMFIDRYRSHPGNK